ncbi:hypothetical protein GW17_00049524 [Ensete ventricosum]|nr:hypothetical protein GW17_00049524 [Ensete ventricosum]
MGRQPCCDNVRLKKGPWTTEEDKRLINFMLTNGQCCWRAVPKLAGPLFAPFIWFNVRLLRCGKSCRIRWTNYLRPDLKKGLLSEEEEKMVAELHSQLGNNYAVAPHLPTSWFKIASHLPGRTDNEIKNHWNTHIEKKLRKMVIDPFLHKPLIPSASGVPRQEKQQAGALAERAAEGEVEEYIPSTASDAFLSKSPGFCTDEVPMIQPHEILASSSISTSSTCSSSTSSSKAAEIQVPCMEWPESTYLWGLYDLMDGTSSPIGGMKN